MNRTSHLPSPFVSASHSLPYALFEARRWNELYRRTNTQISIVNTAKISSDAWLATELVGADFHPAAYFARCAQEVLVCWYIPSGAVVATMSLDGLLDCLPRWCNDIALRIGQFRELRSTKHVAWALADAAIKPMNNTAEVEGAMIIHSVERSIWLLRTTLLSSTEDFDPATHKDEIERRLATFFCWRTEWITDMAYPLLLRWVQEALGHILRFLRKMAMKGRNGFLYLPEVLGGTRTLCKYVTFVSTPFYVLALAGTRATLRT
ncbi:hypothetical protein C8R47DRAFT_1275801 [Mycena vitilis]|nr:hypothetical protein C8R47DRAFT_1275801 [Mycena vitilis]